MIHSIKKIYPYIAALVIIAQASCSKDVFTDANNNPNAPNINTVLPSNLLPGILTSLAYAQGGDLSRYSSLLTQQNVGFSRQASAYYSYVFTSTDFDNLWGNIYTSVLGNNANMLHKADSAGLNIYSGIGRIITAYTLMLLVDQWGDVPYSAALQGDAEPHPGFDKQEGLYQTVETLVNTAIDYLENADPGGIVPGTDDLLYGGDISYWEKFAHAIKARLFMHQSKGNAAMATKAMQEANMAFESNTESAIFTFGTTETFSNPIYQFNQQRADIDYGAGYYVDLLTNLNDPRLGLTANPNYDDVSGVGIGAYYGNIDGRVEFITYEELEFLKAEATLSTNGSHAAAEEHYQQGIKASMEKLGVAEADIDTYIAANGTLPANTNDAIAAVALQEYIALYQSPEVWTLWRRTGIPQLTPVTGSNGVPRRLLYPQSEYSLNAENTPQATLFTPRIFWDK